MLLSVSSCFVWEGRTFYPLHPSHSVCLSAFHMLYGLCALSSPFESSSTFVCPTEIIAFNDRIEEFNSINTEVVACSVDSKYTHLAWINQPRVDGGLEGLKIPLLSDLTKQISKDYGVLLEDAGHTLR